MPEHGAQPRICAGCKSVIRKQKKPHEDAGDDRFGEISCQYEEPRAKAALRHDVCHTRIARADLGSLLPRVFFCNNIGHEEISEHIADQKTDQAVQPTASRNNCSNINLPLTCLSAYPSSAERSSGVMD